MSDLTEHMVERMRVEIAQSAAADLLAALERLPDGPLRSEATQKVEDVRHLVASTMEPQTPNRIGWVVHVRTSKTVTHVVVQGVRPGLDARDMALDALVERGRIKDRSSAITETEQLTPGTAVKAERNEPVIQI